MPLAQCRRLWGEAKFFQQDPVIATHRDVLLSGGGLYTYRRKLIDGAGQYRGVPYLQPNPSAEWQPFVTAYNPANTKGWAPDRCYYWGGYLFKHFGHFLVGTLARLWAYPSLPHPRPKILCWGDDADTVLGQRFVQDLLSAMGLSRVDFVTFREPTMLSSVIVAETSFEENHCAHDVCGRFMRQVGAALTGDAEPTNDKPVYISKARLTSGTARFVNEQALADRLERGGVDIFCPEQHSIADQVRLWQSRTTITGYLGSALLTGLFAKEKNLAIINHEPQIYSNQVLADKVADHRSVYFYPHGDFFDNGSGSGFDYNFQFERPVETAEAFLREIDRLQNGPPRRRTRCVQADSVSPRVFVDDPLGVNLSRYQPTLMSSILPPHSRRATPEGEAGGAVDGTLNGEYGFHSAHETDPWWQVDLGELCAINEVRLFNREDIGRENSRHLRILVSADGLSWLEVDRRTADEPFGGKTGVPYRWQPDRPILARHVRIQLIGRTYFHLHEVEVFGERTMAA